MKNPDRKTQCRGCRGFGAVHIGGLGNYKGLFDVEETGCLYKCKNCGLYFRYPYLGPDELKSKYVDIPLTAWTYKNNRRDYIYALAAITSHFKDGKVLDAGCFRGDFLNMLPGKYGKFGIEPSASAAVMAEQNGIKIICETIENCDSSYSEEFDVVTAMDVIEHISEPYRAFKNLSAMLKPNGILIISTGNTDAVPWKFMRLDYWYYFPEHVCFFNRKWFEWASNIFCLKIIAYKRFSHFETNAIVRTRQLIEALLYKIYVSMNENIKLSLKLNKIFPFSRVKNWNESPKTIGWRDHLFVILKKRH